MPIHPGFISKIFKTRDVNLNSPIVLVSFPDNCPVGVTATKYVIENLRLHQFAHLTSPYVPPATVFIAGRLRHPFRFYSTDDGSLATITCDIPVDPDGYYELASVVVDWLQMINAKVVVNLDGVSVKDTPTGPRTFGVGDEQYVEKIKNSKIPIAGSAMITGLGGSVLSECIIRQVPLLSLLTITVNSLPDPDAVLSTVKALNNLFSIGIGVDPLVDLTKKYHNEMTKIMSEYGKMKAGKSSSSESMYA